MLDELAMLRDSIGFVLAAGGAFWMFYLVISGFRNGRIHHTDSTSTFSLKKQPIRFILVALLFGGFGAMLAYLAVQRAMEICRGF